MKRTIIITCLIISIAAAVISSVFYYKKSCDGKNIYFEVFSANPSDTLKIYLNDKLEYEKIYTEELFVPIHSSESLVIDNYCVSKESIKVHFSVNQLDTIFYVDPDSIIGSYLAVSDGSTRLIIFHNYYVGSLRENTPQDWH